MSDQTPDDAARPSGDLPERPVTSKLAIASPILSIVGVLTFIPLLSVIGVALGVVALNRINKTGALGTRWALAGIAIGIVWIVVFFILVATGAIEPASESTT